MKKFLFTMVIATICQCSFGQLATDFDGIQEVEIQPNDWWSTFAKSVPISNSLPVPTSSFESYRMEDRNGLRTNYMKNANDDTIYGWIQNLRIHAQKECSENTNYSQSAPSSISNEIAVPVHHDSMQYIVKWYSTETGLIMDTSTVISSNNHIKLYIPESVMTSRSGDAAFAIYLDCNVYIWRAGVLNANAPQNVLGNIVCNKTNTQIFYQTMDNKIHGMWWDAGTNTWQWSPLNNLANNVAGDLSITEDGLSIFYRTTNNKIHLFYWDHNIQDWRWSDLNNAAGNVRGPMAVNVNNQVIYRTTDYKLNSIWYNPSTGRWERSELNYAANGNVGDALAIDQNAQVYYKTLDNKLHSIWWNGTAFIGSNMDGLANSNVCGNITITSNGYVVYRTCDNKLNALVWNSSVGIWEWSGLNGAGFNVAGNIMADNVGKVFYRTPNFEINAIYWVNGTWYWSELNNPAPNNVQEGSLAIDNYANVFYRGTDNRVHRLYYKSQCYTVPSANFHKSIIHNEDFSENEDFGKMDVHTDILIYPNPSSNRIIFSSKEQIDNISIYNLEGKWIREVNNVNKGEVEVDVSHFNNGFYLVKIYFTNGRLLNSKFIVKH